jgi:hypothetical protein
MIYQPSLLRKVLEAENVTSKAAQSQIQKERIAFYVLILSSFLAIPVYIDGGSNLVLSRAIFSSYMGVQGLAALSLVFTAVHVDRLLAKMLDQSYAQTNNVAVLDMKQRLHSVQKSAMIGGSIQAVTSFLWLVCPPLWVTHDYLLPVLWLSIPFIARSVLKSVYVGSQASRGVSRAPDNSLKLANMPQQTSDRISGRFIPPASPSHTKTKVNFE